MWLIRHQNGTLMGVSTNKPGDGNRLPDDTPEVHQYFEDEVAHPDHDPQLAIEVAVFQRRPLPKKTTATDKVLDLLVEKGILQAADADSVRPK